MGVQAGTGIFFGSLGFLGATVLFAIFLAIYVRQRTKDQTMKSDNAKMTFWLVILAGILMWTMWICAFMHQMYPLTRPTVPKPVYRVSCYYDALCKDVGADVCNNELDGYMMSGANCIRKA